VNLAEHVLHAFEIVAPGGVPVGQEILHDVTKAFDADTKAVKRCRGAAAQGLAVQLVGFGPALECEMAENQTARAESGHPAGQQAAPAQPLFAVEFGQGLHGFLLQRSLAGSERLQQRRGDGIAGAVQAGWRAYNITPDRSSGVGAWSDADMSHYLSTGHADGRGTASGPMGEAVDESLGYLKASDIAALVTYLHTVTGLATEDLPEPRATPAAATFAEGIGSAAEPNGRAVYAGACAGCHGWTGITPGVASATLTGIRAVNDATATNVAQIVIHGGERLAEEGPSNMPAFGTTYSDSEVAGVANYVTARFGAKASDLTADQVAKLRTQE